MNNQTNLTDTAVITELQASNRELRSKLQVVYQDLLNVSKHSDSVTMHRLNDLRHFLQVLESAADSGVKFTVTDLQTATVLYIDDFFKTTPTVADIDKAFQIINYRYNQSRIANKRCITLISSERTKTELQAIDEAIATRLIEMATPYYMLTISRDVSKNLRLRDKRIG